MKVNLLLWIVIGTVLTLSNMYTVPFVSAQSHDTKISESPNYYTTYLEVARQLLNQSNFEYGRGNTTGAEELAIRAYLDNFEYVEAQLEKKGQDQLKQMIENMMRNELRTMIKERVPPAQLNEYINNTDARIIEAIHLLNNTN
jgi:high-affinity iron transporter